MGDRNRLIAEAYRWQRRLGHRVIALPHCGIVADPAKPDLWDANHADDVTAQSDAEIDAVLAAMEEHLAHSGWRVLHTDGFTPDRFLARLAYLGFAERPVVVQMTCDQLRPTGGAPVDLVEIADATGWAALTALVRADVTEGKRTGGLDLDDAFVDDMVANYRAKAPVYRFHLALLDGEPVAYGAMIAAPNGMGMIEDLFTLPSARRRGIASTMIAHFDAALRAEGSTGVFLGAVAEEEAKSLYYNLGFRPAMLSRCWVKQVT
ncbi:GNAT family N-acetyltransferase [Sphingomonas bacterium]|uniref:GNAT family N-acetyltransferase n=1 Tax=Sphingomonas bacterium TaxID=1895847 RepID=UPI002624031C|nr:GNAT family N-acetyltransferase [Sphingomonas bacterium]MDB5680011.1 N-acetyltransferase [Sphingomonas bacterium]